MKVRKQQPVESAKVLMLVSRVVNSVPVEIGEEVVVQQPLLGFLLTQKRAERVVSDPPRSAPSKKSTKKAAR